jgi:membrane protein YdbS with pleckstrin-like domain
MPWPEDALTADETIVVSFRQHWKLLVIPIAWFLGVVILLAAALQWLPWGWVEFVVAIALLAAFLWLVVRPVVDWWVTRYVLTTERLITRTGLVAQHGIEIPLERITNVNFSQSFWERLLGAGDLLVESAGTTGQSQFANIPRPDNFASVLYNVREQRTLTLQSGGAKTEPTSGDAIDKLRRLKELHAEGVISDAEFETKRRQLLGEI